MGAPQNTRTGQMHLRDPNLLDAHMAAADFTQARLARAAGCSRQFVHMLVTGQKRSCTTQVASSIEAALDVAPHTLFRTTT